MRLSDDIPAWIWLWLVLLPLVIQFGSWALLQDRSTYVALFENEFGAVEILTAILLIPAAGLAWASARIFWRNGARIVSALLVAFALGCIFLLGEEISWGQHYFNWSSPEYFQTHNRQSETNLHNMPYFNKNLLKWFVVSGILVGGLLVPLGMRTFASVAGRDGPRFLWLLPTYVCVPAAIVVVTTHIGVKILKGYGYESVAGLIGISVREITELYIAIFFLIYALSLYRRVKVGKV